MIDFEYMNISFQVMGAGVAIGITVCGMIWLMAYAVSSILKIFKMET